MDRVSSCGLQLCFVGSAAAQLLSHHARVVSKLSREGQLQQVVVEQQVVCGSALLAQLPLNCYHIMQEYQTCAYAPFCCCR
jgi:hypothetical protein